MGGGVLTFMVPSFDDILCGLKCLDAAAVARVTLVFREGSTGTDFRKASTDSSRWPQNRETE